MFQTDARELPSEAASRGAFLSQFIATTACLQIDEKIYANGRWWEGSKFDFKTPEYAFQLLISAMQRNCGRFRIRRTRKISIFR